MSEKTRSLGSIIGQLRPALSGNPDVAVNADAGESDESVRSGHKEELCPHCGKVNPAGRQLCLDCGQKLPVASVRTLLDGQEKEELKQDAIKFGITLVVVIVLLAVSNFIPLAARLMLIVAAIAFMIWRFLAKIMG